MGETRARFRSLSRVWPDGPSALIADWLKLGFDVSSPSAKVIESLKAHWPHISTPTSDDSVADNHSYVYSKELKGPSSFGLHLCENANEVYPNAIIVKNVEAAFDFILNKVSVPEWTGRGVDTPEEVQCENNVLVGPDCVFGQGVVLESGVRIGARVKIGDHTRIGANSFIADDTEIGHHCRLKSHTAIGGYGFGLIRYPKDNFARIRKHIGRVVIGDRVNIGSFVSIDRGVLSDTTIANGTCLDNHIQIAHNCSLGQNNVLCSYVGLSGSTHFGNNVTVGGMVGTKGHLTVGDNVMVAGQSGITTNIPSNSQVKGYPPRPISEALKIEVLTGKLPEIYERLKALEKALK
jgi:UDP-3-O-[3-hydroxymyristoyl] glucosamine N-acyltransferase LpxD